MNILDGFKFQIGKFLAAFAVNLGVILGLIVLLVVILQIEKIYIWNERRKRINSNKKEVNEN